MRASGERRRRGPGLLLLALLLLAGAAGWVLWSSREVSQRREATLAGIPAFPQPHQPPLRRTVVTPPRAPEPTPPPRSVPATAPSRQDGMLSFVNGAKGTVTLIHVNALFNTPLFERMRLCLPKELGDIQTGSAKALGIDVTRDIDRVAMAQGGWVMSGFFEGKPVAEQSMGQGASSESYRGASIFSNNGHCAAQMGNLVVFAQADDCRGLVDRTLEPTPDAAADEIYGDLYLRSDLQPLRNGASAAVKPLLDGLSGMTVRANVWDSVALSFEGSPVSGKDAEELAQIARGAVQLAKSQLDEDQVELQTLADLAKVRTQAGKLQMDLALPANDLFDRLHFPCPGLAEQGRGAFGADAGE
jgi:hypothetical protein